MGGMGWEGEEALRERVKRSQETEMNSYITGDDEYIFKA